MQLGCAVLALYCAVLLAPGVARAQVERGEVRLWLDTDLLSVAWVKNDPSNATEDERHVVIGVGPNQLGAYRIDAPTTPLGLGVGYALRPKWLLGARVGFGYDHLTIEDGADASYLAWSFMPGVWFLPWGELVGARSQLYLNFSALLEYIREKQGPQQDTRFGGCFALGAGTFWFVGDRASFDLGLFFEGHFIDIDTKPTAVKQDISDLRWLLRGGVSLWR